MRSFDYSKLRTKTWDTEILGYVAQIHEYKGRQELFLKRQPEDLERLVEIAKIQSTEASNEIEGIRTTNTRLKQLCAEKTTPRNRDEREIAGYRDVLNTIHENYEYIPLRPGISCSSIGICSNIPSAGSAAPSRIRRTISARQTRRDIALCCLHHLLRLRPLRPWRRSARASTAWRIHRKLIR